MTARRFAHVVVAAVLLALVTAAHAAPDASAATSQSGGPGVWRAWINADWPVCWGGGGDSLWFGGRGHFPYRYDIRTGQFDAATVLDGLPFDLLSEVVISPTGAAATMVNGRIYLCQPGGKWRCLAYSPPAVSGTLTNPMFTSDGELRCVLSNQGAGPLLRWVRGQWISVCDLPPSEYRFAAPKGVVSMISESGGFCNFRYYGEDGTVGEPRRLAGRMSPPGHCWLGDRQYLFPQNAEIPGCGYVWSKAWPITATGVGAVETADVLGLDLKAGRLLHLKATTHPDGNVLRVVDVPDLEKAEIHVPKDWRDNRLLPVRDGNGHLWVGPNRWDGKAWQVMRPSNAAPPLFTRYPDRYRYDPKTGQLMARVPNAPPDALWVDPATGLGWLRESVPGGGFRYLWAEFTPEGPKTLRTVESRRNLGQCAFQAAPTEWWFGGGQGDVFRVDDAGVHPVNAPPLGVLMLSPKGTVWMEGAPTVRYDRERGQFVDGEPFDDFAVKWGAWTLSRPGGANPARVYCKDSDGTWRPFTGFDGRVEGPEHQVMTLRNTIHGQRMVGRVEGQGLVMFDAATRQSILLAGRDVFNPWTNPQFDDAGRLWLLNSYTALMYDGDPFAKTGREEIDRLLAQMDDPVFARREAASRRMKELCQADGQLREELLARENLAPEVRYRLEQIASARSVGLIRRMHPELRPTTQPG